MNLQKKIQIFFIFLLILIVGVGYVFLEDAKEKELNHVLQVEMLKVDFVDTQLEKTFSSYVKDLRVLSNDHTILELVLALSVDETEETLEDIERSVEHFFAEYLVLRPSYLQLRYINKSGQEVVRVDRAGEDIRVVPKQELQDKLSRYYFREAKNVVPGEVYLSRFDLNREHGVVATPHQAVFRLAQSVYEDGVFEGVVIINILATDFLEPIIEAIDLGGDISLVTEDGQVLVDIDSYTRITSILGEDPKTFKNFSEYKQAGLGIEDVGYHDDFDGGILVHSFIHLDGVYDNKQFIVTKSLSNEDVFGGVERALVESLALIILITLLFFIAAYLYTTRTFTKRVLANSAAIKKISSGDFLVHIDTKGKDEVSAVAHGINEMAKELHKRKVEDQKKGKNLKEQTIKLQAANDALFDVKNATLNILDDLDEEKKNIENTVKERTTELEEEKTKLFHVTENMQAGALLVDSNKNTIFTNKSLKEILSFKDGEEQAAFSKLVDFFRDVALNEILTTCSVGSPDLTPEAEKDGRIYEIYVGCIPSVDGSSDEYFGHLILIRDITEAKIVERSKSEFVSIASHQLRTPLTSIRLFSEMLADESAGSLTEEQKEYINSVQESTAQMVDLVNELLNLSRLEAGKIKVKTEDISLTDFLKKLISEINPLGSGKNCEIKLEGGEDDDKAMTTDPKLLRQVVYNFITNAIRYSSPQNCKIRLVHEEKNGKYIIKVIDSGIGIPKKDQASIFKKFFRTDKAVKMQVDGSGLGLHVSKMLAGVLGGEVGFESEEGVGTTFYVILPKKI